MKKKLLWDAVSPPVGGSWFPLTQKNRRLAILNYHGSVREIDQMLANPIRYHKPKMVYHTVGRGSEQMVWSPTHRWVKGLTEAQKEIVRGLPELVEKRFGQVTHDLVDIQHHWMVKDRWVWFCTCGGSGIFTMSPELAQVGRNLYLEHDRHQREHLVPTMVAEERARN